MSTYDNPNPNEQVENERVNRQIAEDVAVGEAARADAANIRADVESARAAAASSRANQYAQGYVARSVEATDARMDRDAAIVNGQIASEQARSASGAFWLLLGLVVVALAIGALWYSGHSTQPVATTTTVISREMPATPAPAASAPATAVTTVPVPVPVPVPATAKSAPSHTTNNVNVYPPAPAAPAHETSQAPNVGSGNSDSGSQPLHGYVEPNGASPAASGSTDNGAGSSSDGANGGQ